jgi:hypothetical protein
MLTIESAMVNIFGSLQTGEPALGIVNVHRHLLRAIDFQDIFQFAIVGVY